jgi:4'-phosphopantetheinyl transferase-like protein
VIEKILPDAVASCEAFDDPPDAALFPEEEAVISRAVEKRRREFRTVRHCARRALTELGLPPRRCCLASAGSRYGHRAWWAACPLHRLPGPPRSLTDARD